MIQSCTSLKINFRCSKGKGMGLLFKYLDFKTCQFYFTIRNKSLVLTIENVFVSKFLTWLLKEIAEEKEKDQKGRLRKVEKKMTWEGPIETE